MILRINNLSREYGKSKAVNGVSFDMNQSDYVAIVGPSGSGKTTLLSMITGMLSSTSGEVYFDTTKVSDMSNGELGNFRAKNIGLIFQFSELLPHLDVEENILLPALLVSKFSPKEYLEKCEYLIRSLHLESIRKSYPSKLSGGQIQMTAIARSLINEPELLLADEPSGDLDPENSELVRNLLYDFNSRGLTILLVTHDMNLAFDAKTIYEMREGEFTRVVK
ncbi:ABC transporter ATP-binding protein [Leptospira interrogans]|uniref:ATPase component of ABC-type antimicrobial peptide transport system n=24 Tax=Leptospira TaxID=171 RepID=Q8F671_LEPIN|nr:MULTISPECIES: ABC transporter ATP-binding protein [Leptospira]APH42129.1 ABC transporter, ATP-binding protein [Leptospira interrogans serovar Copenhageni/Icterohaemorrhagiae]EMF44620.1 ABC transporter, ATP-binding protein [Leptospira interrogans serovar Lora str. TE 1992]EMF70618.1 ABC transporter, ATP-binding protein [Leptospira interrogans serovar Canicola str. LT1962]EMG13518.1 ABC transporter, ATP-binding protein [Leptospira interrogans serovar Grippotyphosa str. LT2186]EMM80372.1 ABC t